jgi:ATP-dependent Clp protease ATP-binding subunit ClpC
MQALQEEVAGQEYAVEALTRAVTLALAKRRYSNRPLSVLLFAGPVGAGKFYVAQSLAKVLLGNERKLIHVNCQLLNQPQNPLLNLYPMSNLYEQLATGSMLSQVTPPFTSPPFFILVFDKIDQAPPVFRDFLAVALDRGVVPVMGQILSLRNTFIILTSDLSKKQTDQLVGRTLGFFRDSENDEEPPRQHLVVLEEIDELIGANLVNRIDEIVIFERLNEQNVITILDRKLADMDRNLAGAGISFRMDDDAKTFLLRQCLEDPTHRVRQIKRVVRNHLEFPLYDLMLSGQLVAGMAVLVSHESPRSFLNFRIIIPSMTAPPYARSDYLLL